MRFSTPFGLMLICLVANLKIQTGECFISNSLNSSYIVSTAEMNGPGWQNRQDIINEQRADSLVYLGDSLFNQIQYDRALARYNQALSLYRDCGNPRKTSNCLLSIGMAYYHLNDYSQAIFNCNEALRIIKNQVGSDLSLEADCKRYLGWSYFNLDDYRESIWSFEEAQKNYQQLKKIKLEAECLWGKAQSYLNSNDYRKALSEFDNAGNFYIKLEDSLQYAKCIYYKGSSYLSLTDYRQSISLLQAAYVIFHKNNDEKWQAYSQEKWGIASYNLEDYREAIEHYQHASNLFHNIKDRSREANSLAGVGDSYYSLGEYDRSARWYEQAIGLLRQLANGSQLASSLLMQGNCYFNLGRYSDARQPYQEASQIFQGLEMIHQEAKSIHRLADVYLNLEQLEQANEFYSRAIDLYHQVPDDTNSAECYKQAGDCHYKLQKYEQACNFYIKAANFYHSLANTSSEANCIRDQAECYFQQKLYSEACTQYELAAPLYHHLSDWQNESSCLFNCGQGFYNLKKYPAALEKYRKSVEVYEKVPDLMGKAESLLSMGEVYSMMSLFPEAIEAYQQALQYCIDGNHVACLADGFLNMARIYKLLAGKQPENNENYYRKAEESYIRALSYSEAQNDSQSTAYCFDGLGGLYFDHARFDSAYSYYQKALTIYRDLDLRADLAICLYNLGTIQFNLQHYLNAMPLFDESLNIYQSLKNSEGMASCHSMFGHTYLNMEPAQSTKARQSFQQSLSLYQMLPEPDWGGEAFCYQGMGDVYSYEGQYSEAKTQYLRAIELYEKIADFKNKAYCKLLIGDADVDLINFKDALSWYTDAQHTFEDLKNYQELTYTMTKIGKLYYHQDFYEDALNIYEKALRLSFQHEVKSNQLICLIDMGNIYWDLNLPDTAMVFYQQSLELAHQLKDSSQIGTCLVNIGNIYYDRNDLPNAQENFEKALVIARQQPESHFLITCLINNGNLSCKRELLEKGSKDYQDALQLSDRIRDPGSKALCLNNLGIVDVDGGKYLEALNKFSQAEKILLENYLRRTLVTVYANKGIVYEKNEQYSLAFEAYKEAIGIVEDIRAGLKREHLLRSFIESKADLYDRMITLLVRKLNDIETAALYLEHSKHIDLQESYRRSALASGDKNLIDLWNRHQKIRLEIFKYEDELEQSRKKRPEERDFDKEKKISTQLAKSRHEAEMFAQELGPEVQIRVKLLQKLQSKIPDDAIFILYHPSRTSLFSFLVTGDAFQVREVAISKDKLYQMIGQYREIIHQDIENSRQRGSLPVVDTWQGKNIQSLSDVSTELYQYLIEPIEEFFVGKKLLTIIPSGQLYYLPIHALARKKPDGTLEFVIERWRVNYLSSLGFLTIAEARSMLRSRNNPRQIVALANADATLPQTEKEVETVRVFAPDAEIYLKTEATEERALEKSKICSILILSTHCMLNNKNPYETFIKLAPSSSYDGRWKVSEVQEITCPNLDLVILSACATAIGEDNPGVEVCNFAESFSTAGASSIIASLWPVTDISSTELMTYFYRGFFKQGLAKVDALRQAQLTLLADPHFRHPLAWAPFILIGDWR